jgi:hypothetical protein
MRHQHGITAADTEGKSTILFNTFHDMPHIHLHDICAYLGHEVDIKNEFSKARACSFLLMYIMDKLEVINFHQLKQRADIAFGERMYYKMHYFKKGDEIEGLKDFLPCIRRSEENPLGKVSILS